MTESRSPTTPDEELLEAESLTIASQLDDAARLERIEDELIRGFGALAHIGKAVSIFGSARTPASDPEYATARDLARQLGDDGFAIITGGGPGIMEAANRGAVDAQVASIGLGIDLPHEQSLNDWVELGLEFHYFFTRKVMFVRYASAFVVFPGGFGTFDELFEAATLRQTQKIRHFPILLFGSDYWGRLKDWLEDPVAAEGKIDAADLDMLEVTDDFGRVLEVVRAVEHRRPRRA
ncbi:MAG: TIGR00730 family Rossman fold protein [Thermoleophilaceae bacterium]|nr:TIGR00730 family Rossman fold protein [Thermoleophilaceae bacterium]